jgi:hypothetical protein
MSSINTYFGNSIYGNPVSASCLVNTQLIGGRTYDNLVMFPEAGKIVSVKKYLIGGTGYSGGTCGSVKFELVADDGSAAHLPTSTVLGQTASVAAAPVLSGAFMPTVNFTAPVTVQANTWYHLVALNTDPSPNTNFVSIDDLGFTTSDDTATFPPYSSSDGAVRNPAISAPQLEVRYRDSGGVWMDRSNYTAVADFAFSSGSHFGAGYMEVSSTSAGGGKGHVVSGTQKVGEVFTVSGSNKNVSSLSVAAVRLSGTGPLTATLLSGGTVVASSTNSTLAAQGTSSWEGDNERFVSFNLSATLKAGVTYQLALSAPSDTIYSVHGVRDGAAAGYGWAPSTVFNDGYANYNTGSAWTAGWDTWGSAPTNKSQDLSFYFSLAGSTTPPPSPVVTPKTLTLALSEDAYRGNAQFIAKLDGSTIAGPTSVTTLHQSGTSEIFDYSGNWSSGEHDLEIDFVNDKYAGAGKDRNLYVDQVKFNGTSYLAQTSALFSNGAIHIAVGQQ